MALNSKMLLKIDSAGAPVCGRARGRAKSTFFGNMLTDRVSRIEPLGFNQNAQLILRLQRNVIRPWNGNINSSQDL